MTALTPKKRTRRKKPAKEYVDNVKFSQATADHVNGVKDDLEKGIEPRLVTHYLGDCILRINIGLSKAPNFSNYTYREDMVMDGVENCLKRINNYDILKPTRTGKPNAFAYFTQIGYFAFLRRIAKEKKQTDIKHKIISTANIGEFAHFDGKETIAIGESMITRMKENNPFYKELQDNVSAKNLKKKSGPRKVKETNTSTLF